MLELLSPAGSMDALRAAVCNGADAVYLGAEAFNARRGAKNFTLDELPEAVRYCHVRDVKVHLTLNTLVSDREMRSAAQTIAAAARAGVDAFIVQDLGVVSLCREIAPNIPLHASTQMSIHSLEGVKKAAEMGISRVVLARELPREDIEFICRNSPVEIEVFVHGALCMCYSGQCYMSAIIGRRSGNRGQCAQPCRMAYGYDRYDEKYPLSLKDNCLVQYLEELDKMGVASIKIEGRMKRPEYVATVTGIYREALGGAKVGEREMKKLRSVFSRQGFTQGYYHGMIGKEMFGTHTGSEENKQLMQEARATYDNNEAARVPVTFFAVVARGQNVMLAAQDRAGNIGRVQGNPAEPARTRELTEEELTSRLSKTGGTPYYCENIRCRIDSGLSVSAAELNRLRRDVLLQLTAQRARRSDTEIGTYTEIRKFSGTAKAPVMTVSVMKTEQITRNMRKARPAAIYVPISEIMARPEFYQSVSAEQNIVAALPRVARDDEIPTLLSQLSSLSNLGIKRVLLGNIGQIPLAQSRGLEYAGDFGLNLFNSRSMAAIKEQGFVSATASFEMTMPQLRDLSKPLPTEMIIYGRLPLMLTENCLMKNRSGICACHSGTIKLVDRIGEEFRVVRDGDSCRSILLNGKKLYMLDKKNDLRKLGLWALRLSFTTENGAEIDSVLSAWNDKASFDPGACTRGLYLRGVE